MQAFEGLQPPHETLSFGKPSSAYRVDNIFALMSKDRQLSIIFVAPGNVRIRKANEPVNYNFRNLDTIIGSRMLKFSPRVKFVLVGETYEFSRSPNEGFSLDITSRRGPANIFAYPEGTTLEQVKADIAARQEHPATSNT